MKKTILITFLLLFFGIASANAQMFIEDGKIVEHVNPGDTLIGTVTIHNTEKDPIEIRAYWEDFEYQDPFDGTKKFYPAGTVSNSLNGWANFSPQEFILPGHGKRDIDYVIKTPLGMSQGHYGVLFFEKKASDAKSSRGLSIVTRVGCLFFVEPNKKDKKADFSKVKAKKEGISGEFSNLGNVTLIAESIYYILNNEGLVVNRGKLDKVYVPQKESGNLNFPIAKNIERGQYTLVLTFDLDDGDVFVREVDFTKHSNSNIEVLTVRN